MYFLAWLAPEPFFSKAFVVTLTLRLSLAVGALELTEVARACVRLYQAQVPKGGLGSLLSRPRFALPRGMKLESATTVQMVADGTVLVTGVAAGTAATTVGSACSDGSEVKAGHHWHHLATNKNEISTLYGGPWTPRFEELFELAGMNLDAKENLVYLKGHKGPHPEEYHREVHKRLASALAQCRSRETCRRILMEMLKKIADEVCTPGSQLHKLLTKT